MKVFISGPMTGLPEFNYQAFHNEAKRLRDCGHTVINPAELNATRSTREAHMRKDIAALCECDAIQQLSGWQDSKGAALELAIAKEIGCTIYSPHCPLN